MARDTVTVPKSLERKLAYWLKGISSPEKNVSVYLEANERQAVIDALLFTARESLSPSSDPEGGARGVQGSIATKQESCPESAPRTETAILNRLFALTAALRLHDDYMSEQFSGPESDALHPKAAANWRNIRKVLADAALTKTPSADHDAGNLRGLAEPNTPRDSSESTTGGTAPDHTTMEERGR